MVGQKLATLYEVQTIYSLEDVYALIEISHVDRHNRLLAEEAIDKRDKALAKAKGRR